VDYVIQLDTKEKRFLFFHLLFHLILKTRERASANFHNPILSDIAHDMIINRLLLDKFSEYITPPVIKIALPPEEYTQELTYESLYDFLEDEFEKAQQDLEKLLKQLNIDSVDG